MASIELFHGHLLKRRGTITLYGSSIEEIKNKLWNAIELVDQNLSIENAQMKGWSLSFVYNHAHKVQNRFPVLIARHPNNSLYYDELIAIRHDDNAVSFVGFRRRPWQTSVTAIAPGVIQGLLEYKNR